MLEINALLAHMIPGLALICLGLWHVLNTIKEFYFTSSANFVSRFWYPIRTRFCVEHIELLGVLSFSVLIIFFQIIDFPSFHFSFNMVNYEHATMYLHLSIFSGVTLFAELGNVSHGLKHSLSGILASSVFVQELFLLHYHSSDHIGLDGHYHMLLQLIVCVSLLSAIATTILPSSFPSALLLSTSVVLQGCWFLIMGFMLWAPAFVSLGCSVAPPLDRYRNMHHGAVVCDSPEASFRAKALANLQFSWVVSVIMIFVAGICLSFPTSLASVASAAAAPRRSSSSLTDYEELHCRGVEVPLTVTEFKQNQPREILV